MKKDDLDIPQLKKKFAHYLKSLKNLTPEGFEELTRFIITLGDKIKEITEKADKTEQDYKQIEMLSLELQSFIGQLSDAQIRLKKKEWEDTEAYYNDLKQRVSAGDAAAKEVLKDFEPVYLEMKERMKSGQASFLSAAPGGFLETLIKSS